VELGGPNRDQIGYFVNLEDCEGFNVVAIKGR